MKRPVTLHLSQFVFQALAADRENGFEDAAVELSRAVRLYLSDSEADRPGWTYPPALRDEDEGEVELELSIDEDLWRGLEEEAGRQGVSVSRLAAHAALYYAAELDAGRITQRILDKLESEGS